MSIRLIVIVAVLIGIVELLFISNPELLDDLSYSASKIPSWFQENNLWLPKPKPPKN
jgi:hypothetical protein